MSVFRILFFFVAASFLPSCSFFSGEPEEKTLVSREGAAKEAKREEQGVAELTSEAAVPAKLLSRGEYLVRGAACGHCHGAKPDDPESPLSGGQELRDAFGKVRAANITPHVKTGIGGWKTEEIVRALRASLGKGERPLSIESHKHFRWLSNEDARAISLYLKTLEPVENKVPKRELSYFERRRLGLFSRHSEVNGYVPSPRKTSTGHYGRYLVHSVANCGRCHSQDSTLFRRKSVFAGSERAGKEGSKAPSIRGTSEEGLLDWQIQDIAHYLSSGKTPGGETREGSFCPWPYYDSFTAEDKQAIAQYLKSL